MSKVAVSYKIVAVVAAAVILTAAVVSGAFYYLYAPPGEEAKVLRFVFAPDIVDQYMRDTGIYAKYEEKYNIKLVTSATWDDFAFFMGGHADVGSFGLIEMADLERETGREIVLFGKYNKAYMQLLVKSDSPYQTLADLEGKTIGINSWGGGDIATFIVLAKKMHNLDMTEGGDFDFVIADYFLLPGLLDKGDIDAALCAPVQGASILMMEGKIRALYDGKSQWEIYKDFTGHDGPTYNMWAAYKDWVDENEDCCKFLLEAWQEGVDAWYEKMDEIMAVYPDLAGAAEGTEEELDYIKEWITEHNFFYRDVRITPEWAEGEREFMTFAQEAGAFPAGGPPPPEVRVIDWED